MNTYEKQSPMPVPRAALFAYHARPGALERLIPPWQKVKVIHNDSSLDVGSRVTLALKVGPFWKRWEAKHLSCVPNRQFVETQLSGPFKHWTHTHEMRADGSDDGKSILVDHVEYGVPLNGLGERVGGDFIRGELERMFAFRHARTRHDVVRHARYADAPRLRVAVSGASGTIASNLIPFLTTAGHDVSRLTRKSTRDTDKHLRPDEIGWDVAAGEVEADKLAACDALVHLAGSGIAVRWTDANRKKIFESRVPATRKLCERLAGMKKRPGVLVCASAVGYYGDRGEQPLIESSAAGDGFAANVCKGWEEATRPAREAGIRVVNLRIGIVLSAQTGALAKLLTPARLGLAGRVGTGRQWMPWIALEDLVGVIHAALMHEDWNGPINAATDVVRQKEFIDTLGEVIHRPTIAPLPAFAVKTLFGQMGDELLLSSQRVVPEKLRASRFQPVLGELESALRFELGR